MDGVPASSVAQGPQKWSGRVLAALQEQKSAPAETPTGAELKTDPRRHTIGQIHATCPSSSLLVALLRGSATALHLPAVPVPVNQRDRSRLRNRKKMVAAQRSACARASAEVQSAAMGTNTC